MPVSSTKRKRPSGTSLSSKALDAKHHLFTQWAQQRGVEIDGVEPASLPGRGIGLVTTKSVKKGHRFLFVPEKAMFKPDSALLKREKLEQTSPQAQLAFSAMVAFTEAFTEAKPLHIWQDVWPTANDFADGMPMWWPDSLHQFLPPPVLQPLERQLADYRRDRDATEHLFKKLHCREDDFKYHWTIVNNRSFHWKPPRARSGMMVMVPFIDYINHGPTGSGCDVNQTPYGYEVIANRNYESGEEILATYGAHSNDKLLVHYGFICSNEPSGPSPDDDIRLDHAIIPKLSDQVRTQLQDVGFLGAYALLPASNELCFKTQVAIRAALLTSNEWEYFLTNGEDLGVNHTSAVNDFVKNVLIDYREEALEAVEALQGREDQPAAQILLSRLRQIVGAIDAFSRSLLVDRETTYVA